MLALVLTVLVCWLSGSILFRSLFAFPLLLPFLPALFPLFTLASLGILVPPLVHAVLHLLPVAHLAVQCDHHPATTGAKACTSLPLNSREANTSGVRRSSRRV